MSKVKLKKISIVTLNDTQEKILQSIQRLGVVEVKESSEKDEDARKISEAKIVFDRNMQLAEEALEILDKYNDGKSAGLFESLAGPIELSLNEYNLRTSSNTSTLNEINKILQYEKTINESKLSITREENRLLQYELWKNLDVSMNTEGTEHTKFFIGSIKNEYNLTGLYDLIEKNLENHVDYELEYISSTKEMTSFLLICHKEDVSIIEETLKKIEFARPMLSGSIPEDEIDNTKVMIGAYNNKIKVCEERIKKYISIVKEIKFFRDTCSLKYDEYDAIGKLTVTENTALLEGYIPEKIAKKTKNYLESKYDAYIDISDIPEDEEAPVLLKNGFYAEPMETVVGSYSYPNKNEIDPSGILSIFYYVLFGLMLSDAGYGLLLALGTGILLLKVKNMKPDLRKMLKLFFFGGLFTIFWGILFGSFFGNAVDVIAHYIRGTETVEPVFVPFLKKIHVYWFNPVDDPMRLLVFAFIIGLVHLFTGICLKGYLLIKQKLYKDFVYDVLFWIMFVAGGVGYLLTMEMVTGMVGMEKPLGGPVPLISAIVMGIGCLGVVLTSGRESKNWFKRLLKGAYGAYGITGWLSDVLSYSRLLALGLATGIIAEVFNTMGSMVKIPVLGLIIFILVFIIGHALNLGINVMGAYVHTNRLQFVEFFGKFYEGGGKKFTPFNENTRYYHIKED